MLAPSRTQSAGRSRGRLDAIRVRLVIVLLVPFVVLMGVSTIQAASASVPGDRFLAILVLLSAGLALPAFMAAIGRTILQYAGAIDAERSELLELYNRARLDALLTG